MKKLLASVVSLALVFSCIFILKQAPVSAIDSNLIYNGDFETATGFTADNIANRIPGKTSTGYDFNKWFRATQGNASAYDAIIDDGSANHIAKVAHNIYTGVAIQSNKSYNLTFKVKSSDITSLQISIANSSNTDADDSVVAFSSYITATNSTPVTLSGITASLPVSANWVTYTVSFSVGQLNSNYSYAFRILGSPYNTSSPTYYYLDDAFLIYNPAATNLVSNGNFETATGFTADSITNRIPGKNSGSSYDFNKWFRATQGSATAYDAIILDSGNNICKVAHNIYHGVPVQSGKNYQITFRIKSDNITSINLGIANSGNTDVIDSVGTVTSYTAGYNQSPVTVNSSSVNLAVSASWMTYTVKFSIGTLTGGLSYALRIAGTPYDTGNPTFYYMDDVVMIEKPNQFQATVSAVNGTAFVSNPSAVDEGSVLTVIATANKGFVFDGWYESNVKVSSSINYSFQIAANHTLVAKFVNDPSIKSSILAGTYQKMLDDSIDNEGNMVRIANAMRKAQSGQPITVGFIGGSITEGATAGAEANRYANLVKDWWVATFPQSTVTLVNAGIGSTTSLLGVHRVVDDLLSHNPDFVVVDFTTNDAGTDSQYRVPYENLVRRILEYSSHPGVLAVYFGPTDSAKYNQGIYERAINSEANHKPTGLYYDIPIINYINVAWQYIDAGYITWPEIAADYIHPNATGHRMAASCINNYLSKVYSKLSTIGTTAPSLPSGFFFGTDIYMNGTVLDNDNIQPSLNTNYSVINYRSRWNSWQCLSGTGELTFTLNNCKAFSIMRELIDAGGSFDVYINGQKVSTVSCNQTGSTGLNWLGYTYMGTKAENLVVNLKSTGRVTITSFLYSNGTHP